MNAKHAILFLIPFLVGCSTPPPSVTSQAATPSSVSWSTPVPTLTELPGVTPTQTLILLPQPFIPFYVSTAADNVVLRSNPGYLFDAELVLRNSAPLLVLGRTPGSEWILVQYPYGQTGLDLVGWVYSQLLVSNQGDLKSAPLFQPGDVQLVRGHVEDASGNPVSGVQFALVGGASDNAPRNDAMTDERGDFYAYMPSTYNGTWSVGYVALSCKSNVMDANCKCLNGVCGKVYPDSMNITLPNKDVLNFIWK